MMHFVFKVGPIAGLPTRAWAYFVHPGRENRETFFSANDRDAFAQLMLEYQPGELECEPQLASEGRELGIASGKVTPDRAAIMALVTFDIAAPGHFQNVQRHDLIYQYGMACNAFWRSRARLSEKSVGSLLITFRGDFTATVEASILGGGGGEFGLGLFLQRGSLHRLAQPIECADIEITSMDLLGVSLAREPPFAIDAMRRAFDLERLPVPLRAKDGRRTQVSEHELLILTGALRAIAAMGGPDQNGAAEIALHDLSVHVIAKPHAIS
ncbi:MAG: hypothetical protein QOC72_2044 [Methylobacteriaceae bacterium]|jgi:hypothetical protein|nr:hypothetical protein [Methylobacteriaceae bacterium]